ncbi:hypothetical protein EVAR_54145_1 [Eumeta japonica]|uniref:Uncharacterized protein n=1 Tax=Eumeta variegata TaxID=151549 RepID=A0A4C1Y3S7_EUMVA|nr:hypothetical protein EVAR_54145_1 [Eumeta japonica]
MNIAIVAQQLSALPSNQAALRSILTTVQRRKLCRSELPVNDAMRNEYKCLRTWRATLGPRPLAPPPLAKIASVFPVRAVFLSNNSSRPDRGDVRRTDAALQTEDRIVDDSVEALEAREFMILIQPANSDMELGPSIRNKGL